MNATLKFKIVTPERVIYEDEIMQVSIPTTEGEITVLANHIPLVCVLKNGEISIVDKEGTHPIAISGGFLEVKDDNQVIILADNAERAEEIDLERAEKARMRAQEQIEKADKEADIDFAKLQSVIDREMNRLKVGKKYKKMPRAKS